MGSTNVCALLFGFKVIFTLMYKCKSLYYNSFLIMYFYCIDVDLLLQLYKVM